MTDEEVASRAREAEEEAEDEEEEDEEETARGPASEKERIERYRKKLRDLRVIVRTFALSFLYARAHSAQIENYHSYLYFGAESVSEMQHPSSDYGHLPTLVPGTRETH